MIPAVSMDREQIILEEETLWGHFANKHKLPLEFGMSDKGGGWRLEELREGKATWNASVSFYHRSYRGDDVKSIYLEFQVYSHTVFSQNAFVCAPHLK